MPAELDTAKLLALHAWGWVSGHPLSFFISSPHSAGTTWSQALAVQGQRSPEGHQEEEQEGQGQEAPIP